MNLLRLLINMRWPSRIGSLFGCEPLSSLLINGPKKARFFTAVIGLGSSFSGQLGLGPRWLELGKPEVLSPLISSSKYQIKHIAAGSEHSLFAFQGNYNDK